MTASRRSAAAGGASGAGGAEAAGETTAGASGRGRAATQRMVSESPGVELWPGSSATRSDARSAVAWSWGSKRAAITCLACVVRDVQGQFGGNSLEAASEGCSCYDSGVQKFILSDF
mmetsp:Transcript_56377/g.160571  ORF Transcript_56377/g.160571 Transcript_56377/m.160571 type:complete len:117 (-) Transcript_56377:138-488(-)